MTLGLRKRNKDGFKKYATQNEENDQYSPQLSTFNSEIGPPDYSRASYGEYGEFTPRYLTDGNLMGRYECDPFSTPMAITTDERNRDSRYSIDNNSDVSGTTLGNFGVDDELTAEEQEQQDVDAIKYEIRHVKKQTKQSLKNSRALVNQIVQTGSDTLNRLGQQGERIHNTEKMLDDAKSHAQRSKYKADELRRYKNRPFFVPAHNPLTGESRRQKDLDRTMKDHAIAKQAREETRKHAFDSIQRQQQQQSIRSTAIHQSTQRSLADRAKYQFEADSEDDEDENQIDQDMYVESSRCDIVGHANVIIF